jgi:hypothetical protein
MNHIFFAAAFGLFGGEVYCQSLDRTIEANILFIDSVN